MPRYPSIAEIDRVAALADPVLRNLLITQRYFELSNALREHLNSGANWCTFATWASRQAGQTIRKEDLQQALDHFWDQQALADTAPLLPLITGNKDTKALRDLLRKLFSPAVVMERASDSVARGNRKVFAEIGREFARFLDYLSDPTPDIEAFFQALRPGDPPDGQEYLRIACRAYHSALTDMDPKSKAENLLLANICIGFHEQTRLQPEIQEALEAALPEVNTFARILLTQLFPLRGWAYFSTFIFLNTLNKHTPAGKAILKLYALLQKRLRSFLTAHLMTLGMPRGQHLQLGKDLKAAFPENLKALNNAALISMLQRIDPSPDSLRESGALDWADLKDRIHFIADMFRCYQEDTSLMDSPLDAAQLERISKV